MTDEDDKTRGPKTVSFGREQVSPQEKTARVGGVFTSVAGRYDVMNDLMSAGIHRLWKADTMARINPQPGERLIDVAGGTGDVARAFLDAAHRKAHRRRRQHVRSHAVICDINEAMLAAGRTRTDLQRFGDQVGWVCGSAEALPFPDKCADVVTITFGIRNVTDRASALSEFRRVLKPAGRLAVLEFSHMTSGSLQAAYDAYSNAVIPQLGSMVAGDRDSYQYLVDSIRAFPDQDAFASEIEAAGFSNVAVTNFSGGIAALHSAWAV